MNDKTPKTTKAPTRKPTVRLQYDVCHGDKVLSANHPIGTATAVAKALTEYAADKFPAGSLTLNGHVAAEDKTIAGFKVITAEAA